MTSRTTRLIAGTLLAVIALAGCAGPAAAPRGGLGDLRSDEAVAPAPAAPPQEPSAGGAVVDVQTQASQDPSLANRMVIRNASLTLVVSDTLTQLDAVTQLAGDLQGYITSSSTSKYQEGVRAVVTLRVPAEEFDEALRRLRQMAIEVREDQISGQDVTAEYTDLTSQLKNLEAAEAQLREIMDNAVKTEDVLAVFNQLTQIRGQIEVIKGRMQFLSQSAALATINVTLIPDALAQPVQVAGWRPEGVAKEAIEALVSILQGLASVLIWLVIVALPVAVVLVAPFAVLIALLRRRSQRKAAAVAPPTAQAK